MLIANYEVARKFARRGARARSSLDTWYQAALKAKWKSFDDARKTFRTADIFGDCAIFEIGGDNYRLTAKIDYEAEQVSIQTVMTRAEYGREKWKSDCQGEIQSAEIRRIAG